MNQDLPIGWDEKRIGEIIDHYETLTDEELAAEDDAAFNDPDSVIFVIPRELAPAVDKLLAEYLDRKEAEAQSGEKKP